MPPEYFIAEPDADKRLARFQKAGAEQRVRALRQQVGNLQALIDEAQAAADAAERVLHPPVTIELELPRKFADSLRSGLPRGTGMYVEKADRVVIDGVVLKERNA